MKKILILSAMILVLIVGCYSERSWAADVTTILGSLPINLNGDTMWRIKAGTFDGAAGMDLAGYKGLITLRAEGSQSTSGSVFAGAGIMLNIPTLITQLGGNWGTNWLATTINPSIGVVPGYDFGSKKFDAGIVLSIISVKF